MPRIFSYPLINKYNQTNIDNYIKTTKTRNCDIFSQYLTNYEINEMERNLLYLVMYLLNNDAFAIPSENANGTMYRAGLISTADRENGYFPVAKSIASNCPTKGPSNEPVWFGLEPLLGYLGVKQEYPLGIVSCRKIRDVTHDGKINVVVKLSTDINVVCTPIDKEETFLLNQNLQIAINKVILVLIVRKYCGRYSKQNYSQDITYHDIIQNPDMFVFTKTVDGYDCDSRYYDIRYKYTIAHLLRCWDYRNGLRNSSYSPDRIQIQALFDVFDLIESLLNAETNIVSRLFIEGYQSQGINLSYDTKINLLGWICKNSTWDDPDCPSFSGEWAISLKYFKKPTRFNVFDGRTDSCKPKFYVYTPKRPGYNDPGYKEITEKEADKLQGFTAAQISPPQQPFVFGRNPYAPNPQAPQQPFVFGRNPDAQVPPAPQQPFVFGRNPDAKNPQAPQQPFVFGRNPDAKNPPAPKQPLFVFGKNPPAPNPQAQQQIVFGRNPDAQVPPAQQQIVFDRNPQAQANKRPFGVAEKIKGIKYEVQMIKKDKDDGFIYAPKDKRDIRGRYMFGGGEEQMQKNVNVYSDKPEDPNSDLFQVFFDTKSDESLYTEEPKGSLEASKEFFILQNNESEESKLEESKLEESNTNKNKYDNFLLNKKILSNLTSAVTGGGKNKIKNKKTRKNNKKSRKNRKKTRHHNH